MKLNALTALMSLVVTLSSYQVSICQTAEINETVIDSQKVNNTILPFVFFLPETGFAFGITGISTFRLSGEPMESRPSQVIYSAAYTLKYQVLFYIPYEIYKNNNKIRYKGEVGFYKYFYNYYGIGNNSEDINLENYDVLFPRVDFNYSRSDIKNIFVGGGFKYDHFDITQIDSTGALFRDEPIGYRGGQKMNLLLNAFYDNRDNVFSTSKGIYAELRYEKSLDFLLSDFDYWKYSLDIRYFLPIKKDLVLASQFFLSKASNETPFFDLPYISTPAIARGFSDRRYINYNIINLQSEIRFPIKGKVKGATFLSSTLIPDSLASFTEESARWSYGIGIRYEVNKVEKTRFRLDVAYGDALNIYLTANEAF